VTTLAKTLDYSHHCLHCVIVCFCLPDDMLIVPVYYCNLTLNTMQKHFVKLTPIKKGQSRSLLCGTICILEKR